MSNSRALPSSDTTNQFSFKRYFINSLDSFQGEAILSEVSKILLRNGQSSTNTTDGQTKSEKTMSVAGEDQGVVPPEPVDPYEIIGTVSDPKVGAIENVARIIPRGDCLAKMLTCGNVVFDISCDINEAELALEYLKLLKELLETTESPTHTVADDGDVEPELVKRHLILISTVMTWACTKPLDPENPEMPFVETDFRKRKPHPNYKLQYDVENEVIAIARNFKSQIGAIVVTTGVTYGGREDVLYFWFQKAWECEPILPIFDRGKNTVPLINVMDFAQVIYNLLTDFPKKLYVLAVEQNVSRQKEIVKSIGRAVGSGMFKCIPPEDAFLIPEMDQRAFDLLTLNLNMEPTFIVESMEVQWSSESPFPENVPVLIKQFKSTRRLKPFKVVFYGPPLIGKTTLAKKICESYNLVYISPETIVDDMIKDLEWRIEQWEQGEFGALPNAYGEEGSTDDAEDTAEEEPAQDSARQLLAVLKMGQPVTDDEMLGYIRQKMLSKEAQNRGWVLDGYPMTLQQCSALYEKGDEEDDEEEEDLEETFEEDVQLYDNVTKKLLPELVVSLEGSDEFVCSKAMRQPESDPRLAEDAVLKRLLHFRTGDARDVTPLNFYDEIDIHPFVLKVDDPDDYGMEKAYREVTLRMGRPCRYPKLMAMIEAAEKKSRGELESLRFREENIRKEYELKLQHEREERMEYWTDLYSAMREEEEQALAIAGEPMRRYLMNHIFPVLTPALLEVAKVRPNDPVDFLAEHLFKLNPTGKMLDPGFNLQAELLFGRIKILDDALKDIALVTEPLVDPEAEIQASAPPSGPPR